MKLALLLLGVWCSLMGPASASGLDNYRVDLAATSRYSFQEPNEATESLKQFSYGARVEVEARHRFDAIRLNLALLGNWDDQDPLRRYGDIRKANLYWQLGDTQLGIGVDSFFWGVSESINVVNVLNQSDMMESFDGKVKLGQSFLSLRQSVDNGDITLYYLPRFRERVFPARPSFGLPVAEQAIFEGDKEQGGFAARGLFYFGDVEFGIGFFKGTRRDPLLVALTPTELTPYYLQTKNLLFDGLYLGGTLTYKVEAKLGREAGSNFVATNFGIEYPLYWMEESIANWVVIAEYLFDDREESGESHGQNDIFLGTKFNFGGNQAGQIRFLYSYDLQFSSQYTELTYSYRLSDYLRINAKVLGVLTAPEKDRRLYSLKGEEFVKLSLHYAF